MGRTWGGAAHSLQFGRHLERDPAKVIRVLQMMEVIARNERLYFEARHGKRGLHWDYNPKTYVRETDGKRIHQGLITLPPYDDPDRGRLNRAEMIGLNNMFFFPSTLDPVFDDQFKSVSERHWNAANCSPEWSMMNVLGKSDVVESSGRYLKDLINYQLTFYAEIVLGDRKVEEFDEFVNEWRRRGGDIVLEEANELYGEVQQLYREVGAM